MSQKHEFEHPREKPLILIVEDVGVQVRLTKICLERENFRVAAARDGAEALKLVDALHPDLILLDVDLPGLNGFQVLDRLRSRPETRNIPVVMLTAHAKDAPLFEEWAVERDAFMAKPYSPRELITRVRECLATAQARRAPIAPGVSAAA